MEVRLFYYIFYFWLPHPLSNANLVGLTFVLVIHNHIVISMTTLLDYKKALAYLAYLGFEGDTRTALKITRPKKIERRKNNITRNVFLVYVFGAAGSGKVRHPGRSFGWLNKILIPFKQSICRLRFYGRLSISHLQMGILRLQENWMLLILLK